MNKRHKEYDMIHPEIYDMKLPYLFDLPFSGLLEARFFDPRLLEAEASSMCLPDLTIALILRTRGYRINL